MNSGAEVHYILAQSHIPASPGLAPGLAHKGQRKEESAEEELLVQTRAQKTQKNIKMLLC